MKSNRTTILFLIVAVAGIWGTIIYKIMDKDATGEYTASDYMVMKKEQKSSRDNYVLLLDYGDPFFPSKKTVQKKTFKTKKPHKKQKSTIKWPVIKYNGCLTSKENVRGHFTYNGKSMILKPGDSIGNHSVLKEIYNDSVLISYNHEQKWFFR